MIGDIFPMIPVINVRVTGMMLTNVTRNKAAANLRERSRRWHREFDNRSDRWSWIILCYITMSNIPENSVCGTEIIYKKEDVIGKPLVTAQFTVHEGDII